MARNDRLRKSMDGLFPQGSDDECRVCREEVVDGRWSYCSERCRDIAQTVQRMFVWSEVRERILARDQYTCQECGLSKDVWWRAYWQIREMVDYVVGDPQETRMDRGFLIEPPTGNYEVDHIQAMSKGGHPLDEENLQTLCVHCHRKKTGSPDSEIGVESRPPVPMGDYE